MTDTYAMCERPWFDEYLQQQEQELSALDRSLSSARTHPSVGRRRGSLGWKTREEALAARVAAQMRWIEKLKQPDPWLADFLKRADLDPRLRRRGLADRHREFIRREASDPEWERSRPRHAPKREKNRARQLQERSVRTGRIDRNVIYERDGGRCWICDEPVARSAFHLDHVVPLARAGSHGPENLRIAHPLCNVSRGAEMGEVFPPPAPTP